MGCIMTLTNSQQKVSSLIKVFAEKSDSYSVPGFMRSAAKTGLKVRESVTPSQRCCTPTGLARARDFANGKNISLSTVKRVKSFASRHGANYKASYEKNSKWWQGMMLWGIPYSANASQAKKNIQKVINWADRIIERSKK